MKLTSAQRSLLERLAQGGVLIVRLERRDAQMHETCWIDTAPFEPMTANALITAKLVELRDEVRRNARERTMSYCVSSSGLAALRSS